MPIEEPPPLPDCGEDNEGFPTGRRPVDFPGISIVPGQCCVDEVPVVTVPVKTCVCAMECNDPAGTAPDTMALLVHGPVSGPPALDGAKYVEVNKLSSAHQGTLTYVLAAPENWTGITNLGLGVRSEFADGRIVLKGVQARIIDTSGRVKVVPLTTQTHLFTIIGGGLVRGFSDSWSLLDFALAGAFDLDPLNPIDLTQVAKIQIVALERWAKGRLFFDLLTRLPVALITSWETVAEFNRTSFDSLSNVFFVDRKLDVNTLPTVAIKNQTHKIAYWGQSEATIRAADIVLVPEKYHDDPIVGENGNLGLDEFGQPLPGILEALARDTNAQWGFIAFREAPFAGCRNIWCDLVYIDEILCRGVELVKRQYEFFETECQCVVESITQEIADLVTDSCMDRILPDDGFQAPGCPPLPTGYPEAISFEYCALPNLDQEETVENEFFVFKRETPTCFRPGQGFFVRVTITAKTAPLVVEWQDQLPAGLTLINGVMSATMNFVTPGDSVVKEYVLAVPVSYNSITQISGTAQVQGQGATLVSLDSDAMSPESDCDTLCFVRFGSQNPNIFGRVFWAGGGRLDPVIPPDVGLWVRVNAGNGSANISPREQSIVIDTTVAMNAVSHTFTITPGGTEGFAVGLPVWIFNSCFASNPLRKITCHDIEAEEILADPDEEITGLYGTVTAINPILNTITVQFYVPPNQAVDFTTAARAAIMVAPRNSKGFYWEASAALANLCGHLIGEPDPECVMRWDYRFWNSTQNPCPGTLGAGFVCDGDGVSQKIPLHGDLIKRIINPVDWIDLWCSPMQEITLKVNADIGEDEIQVCDVCPFEPCDIVQIVDLNCSGREGNGPGYVASVVSTLTQEDCDVGPAQGIVTITPPIPATIEGCPGFDGFKTARKARIFKKPDICRIAFGVTTKCDANGVPLGGPNFVCVDFENGVFTFHPSIIVRNTIVCYRSINHIIQMPFIKGIYFLVGLDKSGCKSPPSKPIRITLFPVPECPIQMFTSFKEDGDVTIGDTGGAFVPVTGTEVIFEVTGEFQGPPVPVKVHVSAYAEFDAALSGSLHTTLTVNGVPIHSDVQATSLSHVGSTGLGASQYLVLAPDALSLMAFVGFTHVLSLTPGVYTIALAIASFGLQAINQLQASRPPVELNVEGCNLAAGPPPENIVNVMNIL